MISITSRRVDEDDFLCEVCHRNNDLKCIDLLREVVVPAVFALGYTEETIYQAMYALAATDRDWETPHTENHLHQPTLT